MHFEIKPGSNASVKSGTRRDGRAYSIREQECWLHSNGEIRKVTVPLSREQEAYKPGIYELDDQSFEVGRFGQLEIGRAVLRPRVASATRVAG